jgi:hypothetical protein
MYQPVERFAEVRDQVLDAIRRFPARHRKDVLFGEWSLKDLVAHLTGWDVYFTTILRCLETAEKAPYWGNITKFNEASVEKRRASSWKKVYEEFVVAGHEFIRCYGQLSEKTAETRFWKSKSYTPASIIRINIHHYAKSHLPEIEKKIAALKREQVA